MSRACVFFLFLVLAAAQSVKLPDGVEAVWDVKKAAHESTPTRERISINGLWRWQPAVSAAAVPAGGWGYLRVPESWPEGKPANPFDRSGGGPTVFFPQRRDKRGGQKKTQLTSRSAQEKQGTWRPLR